MTCRSNGMHLFAKRREAPREIVLWAAVQTAVLAFVRLIFCEKYLNKRERKRTSDLCLFAFLWFKPVRATLRGGFCALWEIKRNLRRILQIMGIFHMDFANLQKQKKSTEPYRFANYRLDVLQFQTHSYISSYLWEFYIILMYFILLFSLARSLYSSHLVFIVHCATTLAPAPRWRRRGRGEHVALSNNRTFLCNHREEIEFRQVDDVSVVARLHVSPRCDFFFRFRICVKEIGLQQSFHPWSRSCVRMLRKICF